MATVRKTITLTDAQAILIKAQVDSGEYADESECIRDFTQQVQERRSSLEAIRSALIAGEVGGESSPINVQAFKQQMVNKSGRG